MAELSPESYLSKKSSATYSLFQSPQREEDKKTKGAQKQQAWLTGLAVGIPRLLVLLVVEKQRCTVVFLLCLITSPIRPPMASPLHSGQVLLLVRVLCSEGLEIRPAGLSLGYRGEAMWAIAPV